LGLLNNILNLLGSGALDNYIPDLNNLDMLNTEEAQVITNLSRGVLTATGAGIVGLVLSIIATATKRGRGLGIIGMILGILAPFTAIIAFNISMALYGGM